jgi:hypothetical protein
VSKLLNQLNPEGNVKMSTETRVEIVSTPVLGPRQRFVHGRVVGPTDEEYPPGTGGPLPRAENLLYATHVVTTTRDTVSGHTHHTQTPLDQHDTSKYSPEELASFQAAANKARHVPGHRFLASRPLLAHDNAPAGRGAMVQGAPTPLTPERQASMDKHFRGLSPAEKFRFRGEYPAYIPSPSEGESSSLSEGSAESVGSVGSEETTGQDTPATVQAANARRVRQDQSRK